MLSVGYSGRIKRDESILTLNIFTEAGCVLKYD